MFQTTFEEVKELVLAESFVNDLKVFFSAGWRILTVISAVIFVLGNAIYQVTKPRVIWFGNQTQVYWNQLTNKGEESNDSISFSTSVLLSQTEHDLKNCILKAQSITQHNNSGKQ